RFLAGRALSRCRPFDRLAPARRDGGDRLRLFRLRAKPFPPRDLWKLKTPRNQLLSTRAASNIVVGFRVRPGKRDGGPSQSPRGIDVVAPDFAVSVDPADDNPRGLDCPSICERYDPP